MENLQKLVGNRLKWLREEHFKLNQTKFAEHLDVMQTTLSKYEKGQNAIPDGVKLFLSKNGININWLLTGDGEPFLDDEKKEAEKSIIEQEIEKMIEEKTNERLLQVEKKQTEISHEIDELKKVYKRVLVRTGGSDGTVYESLKEYTEDGELLNKKPIKSSKPLYPEVVPADDVFGVEEPSVDYSKSIEIPLVENLAAGIPIEPYQDYDTYSVNSSLIKGKKEDYCVAKISGTSMSEVGIYDGSFVLLKHCTTAENGAISVVQYEDKTTLKLLHQNSDGSWELKYCDKSGAIIRLKDGTWEVKARYITTLKKSQ